MCIGKKYALKINLIYWENWSYINNIIYQKSPDLLYWNIYLLQNNYFVTVHFIFYFYNVYEWMYLIFAIHI